ncbi:helix-turn-helix domain-containing protein [Lachnoclostridium sp. Marseille-P6806]|uniref:helix-turn-helix domain-containing protein n=1 Tax=Lachnoclostridium sp. Marseille-P6806 TaxID=2364793 RepID=UPI0010309A8A|nr:helix-turn-helix domain-containing protein [Lachnoclostridium sp. Marseille-P6806]
MSSVYRGYKYRLHPTPKQAGQLDEILSAVRLAYNMLLDFSIDQYGRNRQFPSLGELNAAFPDILSRQDVLSPVDPAILQKSVQQLDHALRSRESGGARQLPRHKSAADLRSSFTVPYRGENTLSISCLNIAGIHNIRIAPGPTVHSSLVRLSMTLTRTISGKYLVSLLCRQSAPAPAWFDVSGIRYQPHRPLSVVPASADVCHGKTLRSASYH